MRSVPSDQGMGFVFRLTKHARGHIKHLFLSSKFDMPPVFHWNQEDFLLCDLSLLRFLTNISHPFYTLDYSVHNRSPEVSFFQRVDAGNRSSARGTYPIL